MSKEKEGSCLAGALARGTSVRSVPPLALAEILPRQASQDTDYSPASDFLASGRGSSRSDVVEEVAALAMEGALPPLDRGMRNLSAFALDGEGQTQAEVTTGTLFAEGAVLSEPPAPARTAGLPSLPCPTSPIERQIGVSYTPPSTEENNNIVQVMGVIGGMPSPELLIDSCIGVSDS